jgi:biopolymer transport protein ExbD
VSRAPTRARRRRLLQPGINLTPLLDAIFNLIFFFLLVTTLRKEEVAAQVRLPRSESTGQAGSGAPAIVLDAEGRIYFQGREVIEEELELHLQTLRREGIDEITERSDGEAIVDRLMKLIDICKRVGLDAIYLQGERQVPPPS